MPKNFGSLTTSEVKQLLQHSIDTGQWTVSLPCDDCVSRRLPADIAFDNHKQNLRINCPKNGCPFQMTVPFDWSKLSASETLHYLNENIRCPTERELRSWVMSLKYTHPTYSISQALERDDAQSEVQKHILQTLRGMGKNIADTKFMLLGANNCYELRSLPTGWRPENIHALDPAADALQQARTDFPGINTYVGLIEQREAFVNQHGKELPHNEIDICIAFRSMQSSHLSLWGALGRIRDRILRNGGILFISIPKCTINYLGNKQVGIFKHGRLDAEYPKKLIEGMAAEMANITGSEYFTDIKLYYGQSGSVEYYLFATAT